MQSVNFDLGQNLIQSAPGVPFAVSASVPAGVYNSMDQQNQVRRGLKLFVNILSGIGTLTVTIQGRDPVSGAYYSILTSAPLTQSSGLTALTVYPGVPVAANLSANDLLPFTWRIQAAITNSSVVASIGASLIL